MGRFQARFSVPFLHLTSLTFFQSQLFQENTACSTKHDENLPNNDTAESSPVPQVFCLFALMKLSIHLDKHWNRLYGSYLSTFLP